MLFHYLDYEEFRLSQILYTFNFHLPTKFIPASIFNIVKFQIMFSILHSIVENIVNYSFMHGLVICFNKRIKIKVFEYYLCTQTII